MPQAIDPLDALAAQHGATPASSRPAAAADPLDALAQAHGAIVPDFKASNAVDAAGNPLVDSAWTFAKHVGSQINVPAMAAQVGQLATAAAKAFGEFGRGEVGQAATSARPIVDTVKEIGKQQGAVYDKGVAAYTKAKESGHVADYLTAARHFADFLLPIVGPVLDESADRMQRGDVAAGAGDAVGLGLSLFAPGAVGEHLPKIAAKVVPDVKLPALVKSTLNPVAEASNVFAEQHGIPLDLASATGSRAARAAQKRVANSMGGEGTAEALIQQQQAGLERAGQELADRTHPTPVTPEQAGGATQGGVKKLVGKLGAQADDAYGRLRAMEGDPSQTIDVPVVESAPAKAAREARTMASIKHLPAEAELTELRRIHEELDNWRYTDRTWNWHPNEPGKRGNAAGGDATIVGGSGGAPVYHDITERMPYEAKLGPDGQPIAKGEIYKPTRAEVQASIKKALDTGTFDKPAQGALEVVRARMSGDQTLSEASLPPSAGVLPERTQPMVMPVDARAVRASLQPIYRSLQHKAGLVALVGDEATAYVALDTLMNGPDFVPLSVADAALGTLKTMARSDVAELRTAGQGVAAKAARELGIRVQEAAERAGPDAVAALAEGRSATVAKYDVAKVLEKVYGTKGQVEPVAAYRQMTAPKDTGIKHLRKLQEVAPERMPEVGRAWLDEQLDKATNEGGFRRTDHLKAEWDKLGPETRKILFSEPGLTQELDRFFLLAKRLAENPNPSGTAHVATIFNFASQIATAPLAKILYTPAGVRALTKGITLSMKATPGASTAARTAAQAAAWADVVKAAHDVGVTLPRAADQETTTAKP